MSALMASAAELAADLRVSVRTVYRMTADNEIPFIRVGRQYRYDIDAVKARLAPAEKPAPTWAQSARSTARKRVA